MADPRKRPNPLGYRLKITSPPNSLDPVKPGDTILLAIPAQFGNPPFCGTCNMRHPFKTYHFTLEDDSTVIVSWAIWQTLLKFGMIDGRPASVPVPAEFVIDRKIEFVEEVRDAPPITLDFDQSAPPGRRRGIIRTGEGQDVTPGRRVLRIYQDLT